VIWIRFFIVIPRPDLEPTQSWGLLPHDGVSTTCKMRSVIIFVPHIVLLDEIKVEATRSFWEETGYAYKFWFDSWVTYYLMTLSTATCN